MLNKGINIGEFPTGSPSRRIRPGRTEQPSLFTFSFRFWKQIDHFGVGDQSSSWFTSLFDCLARMSHETLERVLVDDEFREALRIHDIDWRAKNIPITRSKLEWVDKSYLENDDEFPMIQFQVSTGRGRIIGFFDEHKVFNVVLLDPKHNAQPSLKHNYKVQKTHVGVSDISKVVWLVEKIAGSCDKHGCEFRSKYRDVQEAATRSYEGSSLVVNLSVKNHLEALEHLDNGRAESLEDVFVRGVLALEEDRQNVALADHEG